jgi:hypothetical protein
LGVKTHPRSSYFTTIALAFDLIPLYSGHESQTSLKIYLKLSIGNTHEEHEKISGRISALTYFG